MLKKEERKEESNAGGGVMVLFAASSPAGSPQTYKNPANPHIPLKTWLIFIPLVQEPTEELHYQPVMTKRGEEEELCAVFVNYIC